MKLLVCEFKMIKQKEGTLHLLQTELIERNLLILGMSDATQLQHQYRREPLDKKRMTRNK